MSRPEDVAADDAFITELSDLDTVEVRLDALAGLDPDRDNT